MDFAQHTIDLARRNVAEGGRPFATVIVRDGQILAESPNLVAQTADPTAHAPWNPRRLPMRHEPRGDAVEVYRLWQERNGGERRVAGAPTAG
ncbi:hypothetical protein ACIA5E_00695 [Nocardia asteroides]|uniref:hypothetical protein n=1 Tax=Nocardia asteroides TaxID=1824 RepID=UPI00379A0CAE